MKLCEYLILYILEYTDNRLCIRNKYELSFLNHYIFYMYNLKKKRCQYSYNNYFSFCNTHRRITEIHHIDYSYCSTS